jgi:rhodanese-related sulfurtransferase
MKQHILKTGLALVLSLSFAAPLGAYDHGMAAMYADMFGPVKGAKAGKHLHLIKPDQLVKDAKSGKVFVTVDIRTPAETQFFSGNLPGHVAIPLAELFEAEQLARLPDDRPIVIICKSGTRAAAAATALRSIGFEQTYVLKGGFKGLVGYLGPKEANQPLGPKAAAR